MAEDNQTADDISQQYQQILNQYANEITPQPSPPLSPPLSPPPPPVSPPTVPLTPPRLPTPPVSPPQIPLTPSSKPTNSFFKYFFFFSVFIFLSVVAALVYSILSSQQIINYQKKVVPTTPVSPGSPTPVISDQASTPAEGVCQLNDKNYGVGESFAAADGCNTCSCQSDLTIKCSEKDCGVSSGTNNNENDETSLKKFLSDKYKPEAEFANIADNSSTLDIQKTSGNFIRGNFGYKKSPPGGMFYAQKVNNQWQILGKNLYLEVPFCSDFSNLKDIPREILPECFDEPSQKTITR